MSNIDQKEKTLKQEISAHVETSKLSDRQLQQLMSLQNNASSNSSESSQHSSFGLWQPSRAQTVGPRFVMAACLLLAIFTFFPTLSSRHDIMATSQWPNVNLGLFERIAEEVVKNHLKLKPLDISSSSINETQAFFELLDFLPIHSPSASQHLLLNPNNLLGGRYCSIQGVTAAQLRYRSPDGLRTLYQVPYERKLYGNIPQGIGNQTPVSLSVKGLLVSVWQEQGLLMVLVSPSHNPHNTL